MKITLNGISMEKGYRIFEIDMFSKYILRPCDFSNFSDIANYFETSAKAELFIIQNINNLTGSYTILPHYSQS